MEAKARILVVDDDLRLRDLLSRYLSEQGFEALTVSHVRALDQALLRNHIDVVVLDVMLPGEDGLSICRRLRGGGSDIGIVMLTAKGDDVDRIVGLELGADDYLCKPFNPRELVARLNALLRRRAPGGPPRAPAAVEHKLTFGACVLDLATRTLTRDGEIEWPVAPRK